LINLTFFRRINKRYLKFFSVLFLICLIAPAAWAEGPYYFKNGGNDSLDGLSDATAWANPSVKLDGQTFDAGTDFYFKQGDTFTVSNDIDIQHSGVNAANYSIFGCYEGDGDFNCSGARPIINQSNANQTVLRLNNDNEYLRFEYLDIRNSNASWENVDGQGIATVYDGGGGNNEGGYLTVTNCNFYHHGHYALQLAQMGNYNIITNNTFTENGNGVYFVDESGDGPSYNYIAGNTCVDTGSTSYDGHCVGLQSTHYTIVDSNTSTGDKGPYFLWVKSGLSADHNIFSRNKAYGSDSGAIFIQGAEQASPDTGTYGNLIYGNIVTDTGLVWDREAIRIQYAYPDSRGNRVFNNTIYNARFEGIGVRKYTDYTYWKNNIVHTNDLSSLMFRFQDSSNSGDNLIIDYNLYWTASETPLSSPLWQDSNGGNYNWEQWKTVRNKDTKSPIPADPKFTDPSSYDFTLSSTSSPAYDAGGYLSYVITSSGTTVSVADSHWFHGDYGLVDADGNPITGMEITFYDETNGLQHRIITSDFIKHGTPGTFVVNNSIKSIYDSAHLYDPAYTTQVSLRFFGTRPDIGAEEYNTNSLSSPFGLKIIVNQNETE
jgi:Right handed beta helix region